jgi:hypothetical protein
VVDFGEQSDKVVSYGCKNTFAKVLEAQHSSVVIDDSFNPPIWSVSLDACTEKDSMESSA